MLPAKACLCAAKGTAFVRKRSTFLGGKGLPFLGAEVYLLGVKVYLFGCKGLPFGVRKVHLLGSREVNQGCTPRDVKPWFTSRDVTGGVHIQRYEPGVHTPEM